VGADALSIAHVSGQKPLTTWVTSKEIIEIYDISYSTLTHYTNLGLFSVYKGKGNKRLYNSESVRMRFKQIMKMIDEGYPLRLIKKRLTG